MRPACRVVCPVDRLADGLAERTQVKPLATVLVDIRNDSDEAGLDRGNKRLNQLKLVARVHRLILGATKINHHPEAVLAGVIAVDDSSQLKSKLPRPIVRGVKRVSKDHGDAGVPVRVEREHGLHVARVELVGVVAIVLRRATGALIDAGCLQAHVRRYWIVDAVDVWINADAEVIAQLANGLAVRIVRTDELVETSQSQLSQDIGATTLATIRLDMGCQ